MRNEYRHGDDTLVVEAPVERITALTGPDKNWRYTDARGHVHEWDDGYPTLRWVIDEVTWCADCREEHEHGHYECALCGERIEPGTTGPVTHLIEGAPSYMLNGEPITESEASQWMVDKSNQS